MVRTGHGRELYDYDTQKRFQDQLVSRETVLMPFIRPPYDALVFVPFSFLSYTSAYIAFLLLSVALLAVSVRLLRPWTGNLQTSHKWLPAAIFASFVPVATALILGQDSTVLLALLCASTVALEKERDFTAGALAGMGLFKFHFLIPLALLLLCWRRFRFFAGFSAVAAGLALISVWVAHPAQLRLYAGSLVSIGGGNGQTAELLRYSLPITMMANVHGMVAGFGERLPSTWQTTATFLLGGAVLLWAAIAVPRTCARQWLIPIAVTASVLASYYLFIYDLTILLLPITVALNWSTSPGRIRRSRLLSLSVVLVFIAPACMFFLPFYFYLLSLPLFLFLFAMVTGAKKDRGNGEAAIAHP
jgi:hypothetical protein